MLGARRGRSAQLRGRPVQLGVWRRTLPLHVFHWDPFLVPLGATVEPLRANREALLMEIRTFMTPQECLEMIKLIEIGALWALKNLWGYGGKEHAKFWPWGNPLDLI